MIISRLRQARLLLILMPVWVAACATTESALGPAASVDPERTDKVLMLAQAAYERGRYSEALGEYAKLLGLDPLDETARLGVADCYVATGDAKQASIIYDTLLQSESRKISLGARQGRGLSLLVLGDFDAGQSQLLEVASEEPALWRAWNALGWSYDNRSEWQAAQNAYSLAVEGSPVPHVVLNNWGMSLLKQGNPQDAATKFQRAIELRPDFEVARNNLQLALGLQGRYREALSATSDDRRTSALNNVGYAALLRGDKDSAEKYFLKAVEDSPRFNQAAFKNLQYLDEINNQK